MTSPFPSVVINSPFQNAAWSKEFGLLCACAAVELSPDRIAQIAWLDSSTIDWNELLRLAEHHGVLPLLARNLSAYAQRLPPEVERSLRSAYETNLRRSLWFASELVRITNYFQSKNIFAIPYKGPVLAEAAYGDVALRAFSDLDFLITPASFAAAKQALGDLGYQPSHILTPAVERFWQRNGYECSFDGPGGKYLVELQWSVLPRFYAVPLRNVDLVKRAGRSSFGGRELPSLSLEDSLLILCMHASKHLWMRLLWVCDIAETIRTQPVNWEVVVTRAHELGIVRILGVSLCLARKLLSANISPAAEEVIAADPQTSELGEVFTARLARSAGYDLDSPEYFRWILRLRERRVDQCRYLWRLILIPGQRDLEVLKLPGILYPMYTVIRLARLFKRVF